MTPPARQKADRIFVKNGRRPYRRSFSATETRVGIVILLLLASIVGWVGWKGAHPDPSLFALETDLSQSAGATPVDRGPVPGELAASGWTEGVISEFDDDNLYVKIDGREGYYKSFGFERLYSLSLIDEENPQVAVDIELYDLGNSANAVGAYSGERSPGVTPDADDSGLSHIERNALYLARGRFYLRAIGSEESPDVRAQLDRLRIRFAEELPAESLPWGYALFVGQMGLDPGALAYAPENAFSFGFARNVYSATIDDDAELFVTPAGSDSEAAALSDQFLEGFRQYGTGEGRFVKDRYLGTYATATTAGPWVVGIRSAASPEAATEAVRQLAGIVSNFPLPAETDEPPAAESVEEY